MAVELQEPAASLSTAPSATPAPEAAAPAAETTKVDATDAPAKSEAAPEAKAEENKDKVPESKEVPAEYKFETPEGISLDKELVGEFTEIAKGLKLSQADAQKVVSLGPKILQKFQSAQAEAFTKTREEWVNQVKNDKEVGGTNFQKSQELTIRGINFLESKVPGFKDMLNQSGWGDNPLIFKVGRIIGMTIGEDQFVDGSAGGVSKSPAQRIYPNMNP